MTMAAEVLAAGTAGPAIEAGQAFGHYRLDALLGSGERGEVFRAYDTRRNRVVALRLLRAPAADHGYRARFERQLALAATLCEPHIIPVHDYGEIDGRLFVDMRLVEGVDLAAVLRAWPLSPVRAVDVVSQIADALDAAHAEKLVHRDVTPSSILLVGDAVRAADRGFAYLTGLGVAGAGCGPTPPDDDPDRTRPPADDDPDRTRPPAGAHDPDPPFDDCSDRHVDVVALARVLHECLAGSPPVAGPPHSAVPAGLAEVVARGLATDPDQRYDTAGGLAAAARAALDVDPLELATERFAPARCRSTGAVEATTAWSGADDARTMPIALRRTGGAPARPRRRQVTIAAITAAVAALGLLAVLVAPLLAPTFAEVARIRVGLTPADVVVSTDGQRAYVANLGDDTVSVVDTATNAVVGAPIPVGDGPNTLALTADGGRLYVSNTRSETVSVIDTAGARVVATVPVGAFPDGLVLAPNRNRLYVGNADDDTVSVVDTTTNRVIGRPIPVGERPYGVGISPDGALLYVSGYDSDQVTVIDTARTATVGTITAGRGPLNVAVSRDGTRVYVVNQLGNSIAVIDAAGRAAVLDAIAVDAKPTGLALSGDGATLYVAERDSDTVTAVDLASRSAGESVEPGKGPVALAVSGDRLYVVSEISGELTVLSTAGG